MHPLRSLPLLLLALALVPATANAQGGPGAPYGSSVYSEGPGFRLGHLPLTVHPGLSTEVGYDSNVFYLPSNEIGSAMLRLRAHVDLTTLPPQSYEGDKSTADPKIDFRFSALAEYREYLTSNPAVQAQRSLNVGATLDFTALPRGPFTLRVVDNFLRTVDPRNQESTANYTRDYNRTGIVASYRRGIVEFGLADNFVLNLFETPDANFANNYSNEGELFVRVKVLARTLLTASARAGYVNYTGNASLEAVPLRLLVGASTLFTTWFGASLSAGFGYSFNLHGESFGSVIGSANLLFLIPHAGRITVGYRRDFSDTALANVYSDDQAYVAYDQPLVSRLTAHLDGSVRFRNYISLVDPSVLGASGFSSPTRSDRIYEAHAELNVRATSWLVAGVSYNLLADDTDFAVLSPNPVPVRYLKHSAFARVDIAY